MLACVTLAHVELLVCGKENFRYYNMGITLRAQSPINVTVVSVGDFVLMPEHVRAMFHVAKDLRSKLLISMANDLGWRIGDFLSIQKSELPNLEQQTPIVWIRITAKEKQLRYLATT